MAKCNLGTVDIKTSDMLNKDEFHIDIDKVSTIESNMDEELEFIRISLMIINNILNRVTNLGVVSGKHAEVFRDWAKKSKSQAIAANKLREKLNSNYSSDVREYPFKVLDSRIAELERKISIMSK